MSWIALKGKCRTCNHPISYLYPFIEILTCLLLSLLYLTINHHYFGAYCIFISALIVTIRSDIETMLISRFATLYCAPIGFVASIFAYLPITPLESITGAFSGYFFLYAINALFKKVRHKNGMGEGDFELLFLIGAFTGIIGCWTTLTIGSALGSLYGIIHLLYCSYTNHGATPLQTKIPFGPFLAAGVLIHIFYGEQIFYLLT